MWELWGIKISAFSLTWHIAYTTACCYRTSRDTMKGRRSSQPRWHLLVIYRDGLLAPVTQSPIRALNEFPVGKLHWVYVNHSTTMTSQYMLHQLY